MGRKQDLITKIRMAEANLGLTGAAKLGPLGRHTVSALQLIWHIYYDRLRAAGLVKTPAQVLEAELASHRSTFDAAHGVSCEEDEAQEADEAMGPGFGYSDKPKVIDATNESYRAGKYTGASKTVSPERKAGQV